MAVNQKVKDFFISLSEDEELRGKFEAAAKRGDLDECALLSKENGFEFTKEDLEYMYNLSKAYQDGELTEEQMEMVSGGFVGAIIGIAAIIVGMFGIAIGGGLGMGYAFGSLAVKEGR